MKRRFGERPERNGFLPRERALFISCLAFAGLGLVSLGSFLLLAYAPVNAVVGVQVVSPTEDPLTPRMRTVLVANHAIEPGTALTLELFRSEARPYVGLSSSVVENAKAIQGGYATLSIPEGVPLTTEHISKNKPVNKITSRIKPGFRAITISVDARSGVEGWARAEARVDVNWITKIRNKPAVKRICENATVLSAERDLESRVTAGTRMPSTVTLLVTAEDAAKIQLAQVSGALALTLRGDDDPRHGEPNSTTTIENLLDKNSIDQPGQLPSQGRLRIRDADGTLNSYQIRNGVLEVER